MEEIMDVSGHFVSFPLILMRMVSVPAPPSLVEWPESLTRPRAGTARFVCQAEGVPTPHITWLKNGERVHSNGRIKMYHRYSKPPSLFLSISRFTFSAKC